MNKLFTLILGCVVGLFLVVSQVGCSAGLGADKEVKKGLHFSYTGQSITQYDEGGPYSEEINNQIIAPVKPDRPNKPNKPVIQQVKPVKPTINQDIKITRDLEGNIKVEVK